MTNPIYVFFANIVSNALLQESIDDQHTQRVMSSMQRQMTATAEACNGEVVKSDGESFMCNFASVGDALNGAAAIMWAVESGTFPEAWQFSVKAGLCSSEEMLLFDNWAQLAQLARPHQILVTSEIAKKVTAISPFRMTELPAVRINVHSSPVWEFRWRESDLQESASRSLDLDESPKHYPALIIQTEGFKRIIQREGDTISIGRDISNDLVISESIVSRHHVHITMRNGRAVLSDQSTNGTYVFPADGKPLLLLRDQTKLSGHGKIAFEYSNGNLTGSVLEYVVMLEE
jgi:adenylate cyclase